jgi:hypothetical protein
MKIPICILLIATLSAFACNEDTGSASSGACVDHVDKLATCSQKYDTESMDTSDYDESMNACEKDKESTANQCSLSCDRSADCTVWFGCVQACSSSTPYEG